MINQRKLGKLGAIGIATALFYCNAPEQAIQDELPKIRQLVQTPSELELSLGEGLNLNDFMDDSQLMEVARQANESGMRYNLNGKHFGATNMETADEIATVLNQAYQSPLYKDGEEFRGEIVYKEGDKYKFRD